MIKFEKLNVQLTMGNIQLAMSRKFLVAGFVLLVTGISAQTVSQKLQKAFTVLEKDEQLKHAISSLYVIDAKTGQVVYDKNSQIGLAPASTQKIITSVTAFELLGREYRYKTAFYRYSFGKPKIYDLFIAGSGDPTFGSNRFTSTKDSIILEAVYNSLNNNFATDTIRNIYVVDINFGKTSIPTGWIWQDIGNYYGAGHFTLNWRENQYELQFESDKPNSYAVLNRPVQGSNSVTYNNQVFTGEPESGDNAYIYFVPGKDTLLIEGTIPPNKKKFSIRGAIPDPPLIFLKEFEAYLYSKKAFFRTIETGEVDRFFGHPSLRNADRPTYTSNTIYDYYSPSLDSIIYWFNKKSINLYGEALIKTFAYEKQGFGSTDSGVAIVKKFWKGKGLDEDELNIYDGSGLSPMNRVTTHAQVEILKYAKTKEWFPYFLKSLPDYNGMTMKSGTIGDVKGFCGYHKAKDGREYIFSFLVNNYSGKTSPLVGKMYKVLDELK